MFFKKRLKLPKNIKMIISDFDGIFTDNCVYITADEKQTRKLNFKDIMGISLLKKAGYEIAIISGEANSAIDVIAEKFELKEVHQGIRNKLEILQKILEKYNLSKDEIIYIGDDVNDFECLNFAKTKITVPEANKKLKKIKNIQITRTNCGSGVFREVADCLLMH